MGSAPGATSQPFFAYCLASLRACFELRFCSTSLAVLLRAARSFMASDVICALAVTWNRNMAAKAKILFFMVKLFLRFYIQLMFMRYDA